MIRRVLKLLALVLVIVGTLTGAEAQRPDKVLRIGYLVLSPLTDPPSAERAAFLGGLRESRLHRGPEHHHRVPVGRLEP